MQLVISPSGEVTTHYSEEIDLAALGDLTITRASHVEPDEQGRWWAHMVGGPSFGPFAKRSAALKSEVEWLLER